MERIVNKYIKKVNIKSVETYLGINLKNNLITAGFDVSQHSTGIAIIRTTDKYLILEQIHKITTPKLPKHATSKQILDGFDLFLDQLEDFKRSVNKRYKLDLTIIEDCFFGKNVKTLKALARFGILVYDKFRAISKISILLMPSSARSRISFRKSQVGVSGTKLKKEIMNYINLALDTKIKDHDISDAIVLALAGLKEE